MSYAKTIMAALTPKQFATVAVVAAAGYWGKLIDDSETQNMCRFRDRSALYGRPPPPPGEKEIPSW